MVDWRVAADDRTVRLEAISVALSAVLCGLGVILGSIYGAVLFGLILLGSCISIWRRLREVRTGIEPTGLDELADRWFDRVRERRRRTG
jgi:hypothetical protein